MKPLDIQFDDQRTAFEPGELISVSIEWSLPTPPEAIELRAVWNTVGKGTTDIGIEHFITIDSPNPSDSRRIDFPLPDAPYSFSGQLISLVWALELVAVPSKQSCRAEFTMAPGAEELVLEKVNSASSMRFGR